MPIKLMDLPTDAKGIFKERSNRFLGIVDFIDQISGEITSEGELVHIHDPGRLKEILYPGNQVLLKRPRSRNLEDRKTKWDLIAGMVDMQLVLIHSGFHRQLVEVILKNNKINPFGAISKIQPEVRFGNSRLDFLLRLQSGNQIYIEVKGCTLTIDGRALFPDAPSQRASRHLAELMNALHKGYRAAVIILVFRMDSKCFAPNSDTDPKFTEMFHKALNAGVEIIPLVLSYENGSIIFNRKIPVCSKD